MDQFDDQFFRGGWQFDNSVRGTHVVLGLGVQVRFKGLAVRGEVEYFDIADADSVYLISLGATFTF